MAAKLADVERRYKRRPRKRIKPSLAALRIRDLTKLYRARHGYQLPDDGIGRDCASLMCHHLAALSGDPRKRITEWLKLWCPWLSLAEADALQAEAILEPQRYRADTLAWRLHLIDIDRTTLRITTIGSVDVAKKDRDQRRKEQARLRKQQIRQAKGAKPRTQYEATSISRTKPWEALRMSRAAWYRAGKPQP